MSWFASLSLRARLMIVGVAGVSVALVAGGWGLYTALAFATDRTLDAEALASAHEVAGLIDQGRLPDPVPVSGTQVVQVIDTQRRVVGGSASADRLTPLLRPEELRRALGGSAVVVAGSRLAVQGPLRVSAITAGPPSAPESVLVAVATGDVLAGRSALRTALLLTIPALVAVLAAIAWRVIGRSLRPVEELRLGAERISGADQDERLPVPVAADEVHALAVTLNGMLDRLASARARQRSFVADAAHELRSPLTNVRAQLEVAEHTGELVRPDELLPDVDRLSRLVEDLLLLARTDADRRGPATPSMFDAEELLRRVADTYLDARVPVTVSTGLPEVRVCADRDELGQAVRNLVDNAVRHASTRVHLSARSDGAAVTLSVADDGPGIAAPERERVFERFTRLDTARRYDGGGSGLGLAIVRELVGRADGTVGFVTGPEHELVAEIVLPAPTSP